MMLELADNRMLQPSGSVVPAVIADAGERAGRRLLRKIGTASVLAGHSHAAPKTMSFHTQPCTSPPPVGARARPSTRRR